MDSLRLLKTSGPQSERRLKQGDTEPVLRLTLCPQEAPRSQPVPILEDVILKIFLWNWPQLPLLSSRTPCASTACAFSPKFCLTKWLSCFETTETYNHIAGQTKQGKLSGGPSPRLLLSPNWPLTNLCTQGWTPSFRGVGTRRSAVPGRWGACTQCGRRSASCCCVRPPGGWRAPGGLPGLLPDLRSCHTAPLPWFDKHTLRRGPVAHWRQRMQHMDHKRRARQVLRELKANSQNLFSLFFFPNIKEERKRRDQNIWQAMISLEFAEHLLHE